MATISVIVPVYNVREYLERCVQSIINQTYTDLEIILIDDGSTDGSGELCDELRKIDERIFVVHQKNQGLSGARNTGIKCANGEFLSFIDSDDWIEKEFYERLFFVLHKSGCDMVSCRYQFVLEGRKRGKKRRLSNDYVIMNSYDSKVHFLKSAISGKNNDASCCTKLYRKSAIENQLFVSGMMYEDVVFNWKVLNSIDGYARYDYIGYNYFVRKKSITQSSFSDKMFDLEKGAVYMMEEYQDNSTEIKKLLKQYECKTAFSILIRMLKEKNIERSLVLEYVERVKKNYVLLSKSSMTIEKKIVLFCMKVCHKDVLLWINRLVNIKRK